MAIGGVQNGVIETLSRADRDRFDYAVLCYKKRGEWADRVEALGIPVHAQKALPVWHPFQIARLARVIRRINPDVMHISMAPSVIVGATAARLAGVPRIVIQHNNLYDLHWDAQRPILNAWEWSLTRGADALAAVSECAARCTERRLGLAPGRVRVVVNGVNLERFAGAPAHDLRAELGLGPDVPIVGLISRYLETKRVEDFIEAAALVNREWGEDGSKRPVFIVIGGGPAPLAEGYRALIERVRARAAAEAPSIPPADIRLLGGREDLPSLLPNLSAGVLCSEIEGCPNTILEYMAARVPIAATNIDPISELVTDGAEVLLTPPRDPAALAGSISRLLREPELAQALTDAAWEKVRVRDWADTQRKLEAIYAGALGLIGDPSAPGGPDRPAAPFASAAPRP